MEEEKYGRILHEEKLPKLLVWRDLFIVGSFFSTWLFLMLLILGIDWAVALLIGLALIISFPATFYVLSLPYLKQIFFRIREEGLELGSPKRKAFLPFNIILWAGPSSKATSSVKEKFRVGNTVVIAPNPVIRLSRGWTMLYRTQTPGLAYALLFYPTNSFMEILNGELKKRDLEHVLDQG